MLCDSVIGVVELCVVRLGVVQLGVVRLGVVRLGVVRLDVVWLGVVRLGAATRADDKFSKPTTPSSFDVLLSNPIFLRSWVIYGLNRTSYNSKLSTDISVTKYRAYAYTQIPERVRDRDIDMDSIIFKYNTY